jgi:DNA-binding HxlR family transcriptional regulator
MRERKIPITLNCGLDLVREVLYGKWKIHLIYYISKDIKRPGELQRKIPDATRRVLNMQLNQLEEHEIVFKRVYNQLPQKVEYELTDFGKTLLPVVMTIGSWGRDHKEFLRSLIEKKFTISSESNLLG